MHRDFEYINATMRNRRAFLSTCTRAFGSFSDTDEVVIGDLYQLVSLLCPSFPEARILELPRLLKLDPAAKMPFGDLRVAFTVHFAYYDFLLSIKILFISQDSEGGRRLEWKPVEIESARQFIVENPSEYHIPIEFLERSYQQEAALEFDVLVYHLLRDEKLALEAVKHPDAEWQPRDVNPDVAALFQKPSSPKGGGAEEEKRQLDKYVHRETHASYDLTCDCRLTPPFLTGGQRASQRTRAKPKEKGSLEPPALPFSLCILIKFGRAGRWVAASHLLLR